MISGKLALGGLSLEFGNASSRFEQLSAEVERIAKEHTGLLAEERRLIEELARHYLPELSPEAVSVGLLALERQMHAALARRAEHRSELEGRLGELPEEITRKELLVAEAEGLEERAARALDRAREAVERDLAAVEVHPLQVDEHRALMERRSVLKARSSRLQTVANVERHRYEANDTFRYLQRRQYLEPGYRGRFLTRWLDGWLARRIDYPRLERHYRILRTGPHEIRAEIRKLTERAESLEAGIDRREAEAGARLGLDAALEDEAGAQRALVQAREALQEARARHDRLAEEIRAVDAHRGRPYEEAIDAHRAFLADRTIQELLDLARTTADPKDDRLVARLDEVRARVDALAPRLARLREQLEEGASRTRSLGALARQAAANFMSRRSFFSEEFNLDRLVESVFTDGRTTEEAIGRIAESHITRPLLVPSSGRRDLDGWFAELSSRFDPELRAVSVYVDDDAESEIIVQDARGRVMHRRVTRRGETG